MTRHTFGSATDALLLVILGLVLLVATAHCQGDSSRTIFYTPDTSVHVTTIAPIQQGHGMFNVGYVVDSARVELEQSWDTENAFQVERGWCIQPEDVEVDTVSGTVGWLVHHLRPPVEVAFASPYAIEFRCGPTAIASGHVHTPTTCSHSDADPFAAHPKHCMFGGMDGALCSVDEQDRMAAAHDQFIFIMCDKHAVVFWWAGKRG